MLLRFAFAITLSVGFAASALAQCAGKNIIETLPAPDRAALIATAHAAPYATGNFWQATRGDETLYLAGTFHLDDPRFDAMMTRLLPYLAQTNSLLVEAGPKEEAALQDKLAKDPSAMMDMAGSDLQSMLNDDDWQRLTAALLQRGIPSSITEKLRPWFVSMMLSIPPCALQQAAKGGGLDKRLITAATKRNIPVLALEPYDTALGMFDGLSRDDQILMIRNALWAEQQSDDFLATTADAYFDGESRLIWEFSRYLANQVPGTMPETTDEGFAQTEQAMMIDRNTAWIPTLEAALKNGPAFAAFGALHLSGTSGVLALLEKQGFTVKMLGDH
jgi:uncharacterized protein YbaP (TraB family)